MEVRFTDSVELCKVAAKKATEGSFVLKDAVLFEYKRPDATVAKVKSPREGVVKYERTAQRGAVLTNGQLVARIDDCTHAIVIKDMCATCGKDLREKGGRAGERTEQTTATVSMIHHVPELVVSDTIAHQLGSQDEMNLLESHKLVLLVDLDQTVIHTSNRPISVDIAANDDVTQFHLQGHHYSTKVRPYTRQFLERVSKMYELHIVTYGQRQYAHKIAEILDPEKKFFGHRILSRDELFSAHHKTRNLKALFPCGEKMIAIIDDRADVWQFSEALIQVKPYRYFKEVGDINAPKDAPDAKEQKVAEIEENAESDGILEEIERVLTNVHTRFYEQYENRPSGAPLVDIKKVMNSVRTEVLEGCNIVFSGVVPLGVQLESSDIYRIAIQFGAVIQDHVSEETTHLIAARWGTTKVNAAFKQGIHVVTTRWLYSCIEHWMKADEKLFELSESTRDDPRPRRPLLPKSMTDLDAVTAIGKTALADMTSEVDEALSDEDDEDDIIEDDEEDQMGEEDAQNEPTSSTAAEPKKRGQKRVHAPEEEYESESDQEDEETDVGSGVLSYKALLSKSKRTGRLVSLNDEDEDTIASVDDLRLVNRTSKDDPNHGLDVSSSDDDVTGVDDDDDEDEYDDMAAMVERQISGQD